MQTVTSYKADSGKVFDTAAAALADDLCAYLAKAAGNDPIARQITKAVTADIETFATIVNAYRNAVEPPAAELPLVTPNGYPMVKGQEPPAAVRFICDQLADLRKRGISA